MVISDNIEKPKIQPAASPAHTFTLEAHSMTTWVALEEFASFAEARAALELQPRHIACRVVVALETRPEARRRETGDMRLCDTSPAPSESVRKLRAWTPCTEETRDMLMRAYVSPGVIAVYDDGSRLSLVVRVIDDCAICGDPADHVVEESGELEGRCVECG